MLTNIDKLVALIECLDYKDIKEQTSYAMNSAVYEYIFHKIVFSERYVGGDFDCYHLNSVLLNEEEGKRIMMAIDGVINRGKIEEKENTIKQAINKLRKVLKI